MLCFGFNKTVAHVTPTDIRPKAEDVHGTGLTQLECTAFGPESVSVLWTNLETLLPIERCFEKERKKEREREREKEREGEMRGTIGGREKEES